MYLFPLRIYHFTETTDCMTSIPKKSLTFLLTYSKFLTADRALILFNLQKLDAQYLFHSDNIQETDCDLQVIYKHF